jgi:enoyl-CoA hydratase
MAREMVLAGEAIIAQEALRVGLVNRIYASDKLMAAAQETAILISSKGPLAVARAKDLMRAGLDMPLDAANTLERESFAGLFATNDQTEGMQAFLQKREPQFKGN